MKVANEYSAINNTHNDTKGTQQQQHDGINAAVFEGEKLLQRTWMLILTIGLLLSLAMSGQTKLSVSKDFAGDLLRHDQEVPTFSGCDIKTHKVASCPANFYLHKVELTTNDKEFLFECCP